jgi:molybdenum cofactor guanylyltransferase
MTHWGAVILAGGKARRMGGEKATLEYRGKTLLDHAIDLVRPLVDEVVVSTGDRDFNLPDNIEAVPDSPEYMGKGPLAGVASALAEVRAEACLLLPCDLPNLPARMLAALKAELAGHDCIFFDGATGAEPLVAALRVAPALAAAAECLGDDRLKVVPCWRSLSHRTLDDAWVRQFGDREILFKNINTPQDLTGPQ